MDDIVTDAVPTRGKALLVISLIIVSTTFAFLILPKTFGPPELTVRVAVIDSGIDNGGLLDLHTVAARSFISSEYGYVVTDNTTVDSLPDDSKHGSYVAQIIVQNAPNSAIINAKVVNENNIATARAIVAAIQWAILEEDCNVINLSLGGTPTNIDGLREIMYWAFHQGVSIVAASGNNAQGGTTGSSIESPAVYPEVIAVSAVDTNGIPFDFSGIGPIINRTIKPDISALGQYTDATVSLFGTSFAAPLVTAAVVNIIQYCNENDWLWSPGMIKATLLSSAKYLGYPPWKVGAGLLDVNAAKKFIESATKRNGIPLMAWITPNLGIFDFERWFINTTIPIQASIFSSTNTSFYVRVTGTARPWLIAPDEIFVNQSADLTLSINIRSSIPWINIQAQISLQSVGYHTIWAKLKFSATSSLFDMKIAFDFTHTPWWMDSIFGQFREFYSRVTRQGIAIEEIRDRKEITFQKLRDFDTVIVLDPCSWEFIEINETSKPWRSIRYTQSELDAYWTYWKKGGNLMVTAGTNSSIDVAGVNEFLSMFNISLNYDSIPLVPIVSNGIANAVSIVNINSSHPVTERIHSFDYNGASLEDHGNHTILAREVFTWYDENGVIRTALKPVLIVAEGRASARLIVTGSNFFIDNWGIEGLYGSEDNSRMMLQSIYWLTHMPGF
ncbi:MAG: S8 family serine peptidase [Candidatus Thorarchaeota archaeon]